MPLTCADRHSCRYPTKNYDVPMAHHNSPERTVSHAIHASRPLPAHYPQDASMAHTLALSLPLRSVAVVKASPVPLAHATADEVTEVPPWASALLDAATERAAQHIAAHHSREQVALVALSLVASICLFIIAGAAAMSGVLIMLIPDMSLALYAWRKDH